MVKLGLNDLYVGEERYATILDGAGSTWRSELEEYGSGLWSFYEGAGTFTYNSGDLSGIETPDGAVTTSMLSSGRGADDYDHLTHTERMQREQDSGRW